MSVVDDDRTPHGLLRRATGGMGAGALLAVLGTALAVLGPQLLSRSDDAVSARSAADAVAAEAMAPPAVVSTSGLPTTSRAPRTALPGWRQVYAEDFDVPAARGSFPSGHYADHWAAYEHGWRDTSRNGTYAPGKVLSVRDGVLDWFVRSEGGQHLVAAPWLTDTDGHTYGRFSVRFRSDALPGYKTAWLLWPDSERWPDDGEIDFPEGDLGRGGTIGAFSHYARSTGGQVGFDTGATYATWHTATTEWVPGRVSFFLDDVLVGTDTTDVSVRPMHWVLQTETHLEGPAPRDDVAGHVQVDWVAYWTRD